MEDFWDMLYGDGLKDAINNLPSPAQRKYLMDILEEMGKFVSQFDESLTFREFFNMTQR